MCIRDRSAPNATSRKTPRASARCTTSTWLTMLAGLAVAEAIEAVAGLPARLKWPNDVLIEHDGQWRKAVSYTHLDVYKRQA